MVVDELPPDAAAATAATPAAMAIAAPTLTPPAVPAAAAPVGAPVAAPPAAGAGARATCEALAGTGAPCVAGGVTLCATAKPDIAKADNTKPSLNLRPMNPSLRLAWVGANSANG